MNAVPIDEDQVRDALRQVLDPEAGMNIVDLGLVYGIQVSQDEGVQVQITMTSAACPMAEMIIDEAHAAVAGALPQGTPVDVELVWDPPWTPELMSGFARDHFGWAPR
ncbi:MAG TPA: metal-sulfur cluster assembly factor [Rubrivivax sp.]|nr:metal-sulfur cluster assembly factor [Rubrivivax sp.]